MYVIFELYLSDPDFEKSEIRIYYYSCVFLFYFSMSFGHSFLLEV